MWGKTKTTLYLRSRTSRGREPCAVGQNLGGCARWVYYCGVVLLGWADMNYIINSCKKDVPRHPPLQLRQNPVWEWEWCVWNMCVYTSLSFSHSLCLSVCLCVLSVCVCLSVCVFLCVCVLCVIWLPQMAVEPVLRVPRRLRYKLAKTEATLAPGSGSRGTIFSIESPEIILWIPY